MAQIDELAQDSFEEASKLNSLVKTADAELISGEPISANNTTSVEEDIKNIIDTEASVINNGYVPKTLLQIIDLFDDFLELTLKVASVQHLESDFANTTLNEAECLLESICNALRELEASVNFETKSIKTEEKIFCTVNETYQKFFFSEEKHLDNELHAIDDAIRITNGFFKTLEDLCNNTKATHAHRISAYKSLSFIVREIQKEIKKTQMN